MNLINGFRDSFSVIAMKWNSIPKNLIKVLIVGTFGLFLFALFALANTGAALLQLLTIDLPASSNTDAIRSFTIQYLQAFANGELNVYVAGVFGATVLTILILPFSGYSLGGIIPNRDMTIVKSNNNYRLSDSILVQFVSALSILQLVSLTVLSSLLSIEGGTGAAVLYAWATWIVIVFLTVGFMWIIEYLNRRYGNKVKISIMGGVFLLLALALIIDPFHGTTFFGLSPIYVSVLQNIYTYSFGSTVLAYGILVVLLLGVSLLINFVGTRTLMLPEPVSLKKHNANTLTTKLFNNVNLTKTILLLVFRYKVIWRPIVITTLFSAGLLVFLGPSGIQGTLASVMVIMPLVVCLSFGINMFGIFGSSNIWLASTPGWRDTILVKLAVVLLSIIGVSYLIILIAGFVSQRITIFDVFSTLPGFLSTTVVMITYSIIKSIKKPVKYTPSSRGDAILPPLALLGYMVKFLLLGSVVGLSTYFIGGALQWLIALIVISASIACFVVYYNRWVSEETYINNVIKETTSD